MIQPGEFVSALKEKGLTSFTGVPCSFFQAAINCVIDDTSLRYTIVPNEGSALALASGSYLAGRLSVVMIQNSGFGNLVNPLTSLNMIYKIPALLFISGRAYGVPDEPQHEIIGKTIGPILDAMGVKHVDMPAEAGAFRKALDEALKYMKKESVPFVFFVRKDTLDEYAPSRPQHNTFSMKRIDAIRVISEELSGEECVVATTGKPSRELFSVADRPKNFYMQGSMGHAASIGLGLALERPEKKVVVLDGDGALLMHMGVLSAIGHYKPKNLFHIVLDNESYETTGDQDTTSSTTNFVRAASASGYATSAECQHEHELRAGVRHLLSQPGPHFLRVKINRIPTEKIPRISSKYDSPAIASNFRTAL
jgi:phosphonopyruvate decarboxylase